jgi:hypothetical protein
MAGNHAIPGGIELTERVAKLESENSILKKEKEEAVSKIEKLKETIG